MATLRQLRPVLWVADVQAAIAGYMNTLDLTQTAYREDLQRDEVEQDGVAVMLSQPNEHETYNGPQLRGSLYIFTNDVEALCRVLKDTPHVYYRLETFAYGMKEFAVKDGNGYILQCGQAVRA